MARTKKTGRNDFCPCGSGAKFKKCCLGKYQGTVAQRPLVSTNLSLTSLREAPQELRDKAIQVFREKQRKEQERKARFGQIRPQISMVWRGQRWVTVRNKLYYSDKWQFFPDFLRDYVPQVFGIEWCKAEAAKPENERHPIITWRGQGSAYLSAQPAQPDGSRVAHPTGALSAFMCFAYDLYVVDDNGGLDPILLERLKNPEQFQGARHELFAEATCYRAGYTVQHENERDGSTRHAEFTAKDVATGQMLSIEAKSRHREGVLGRPGKVAERPSFTFARLINDAVAKKPAHPLVIFLDTNLPFKWANRLLSRQKGDVPSRALQVLLDEVKRHHGKDPYCLLIFSNHPHHYAVNDINPNQHLLAVLSQETSADIVALRKLFGAATLYGNIPQGFSDAEGEPPPPIIPPRWPKIRYDFHVGDTKEIVVFRDGHPAPQRFSVEDRDRPQAPSPLHEFLEDIGLSPVDAHAICRSVEANKSVNGVYALK